MSRLMNNLSVWEKYLLIHDVKPFLFEPGLTVIKTDILTLFVHADKCRADYIDGTSAEFVSPAVFYNAFEVKFAHLVGGINIDFVRYITRTIDETVINIVEDNIPEAIKKVHIDSHPYTIEVLMPKRAELKPGAMLKIDCPFTIAMVPGVVGLFYPKLNDFEDKLAIHASLIHGDFNGRPRLILSNEGPNHIELKPGEPIAQIQFLKSMDFIINIE